MNVVIRFYELPGSSSTCAKIVGYRGTVFLHIEYICRIDEVMIIKVFVGPSSESNKIMYELPNRLKSK